jgi:hypothetical protein
MKTEMLTAAHPAYVGKPREIGLKVNGETKTLEVLPM